MINKKIIGLTGNIGSGKSSVLKFFADLGFPTVSSDEIAHKLLETNEVKTELLSMFGEGIFNTDRSINRSELAEIIFNDSKKKLLLEALLHPKIEKELYNLIANQSGNKPLIIEIPLLFETGWDKKVDEIIFINCPTEIRSKRYYQKPNRVPGSFESREATQMSPDAKLEKSNFVIDNSGSLSQLKLSIKEFTIQHK